MKAIGVIRNVDNLGRIVIPSEVRRFHNINVGDPMEFFTDSDGNITIRKYKVNDDLTETLSALGNMVESYCGAFPESVAGDMMNHIAAMQKLLEQK